MSINGMMSIDRSLAGSAEETIGTDYENNDKLIIGMGTVHEMDRTHC